MFWFNGILSLDWSSSSNIVKFRCRKSGRGSFSPLCKSKLCTVQLLKTSVSLNFPDLSSFMFRVDVDRRVPNISARNNFHEILSWHLSSASGTATFGTFGFYTEFISAATVAQAAAWSKEKKFVNQPSSMKTAVIEFESQKVHRRNCFHWILIKRRSLSNNQLAKSSIWKLLLLSLNPKRCTGGFVFIEYSLSPNIPPTHVINIADVKSLGVKQLKLWWIPLKWLSTPILTVWTLWKYLFWERYVYVYYTWWKIELKADPLLGAIHKVKDFTYDNQICLDLWNRVVTCRNFIWAGPPIPA